MTRTVVIGLGNDLRGDDAAGLLVARTLAAAPPPGVTVRERPGDLGALVGWLDAERVLVVDALAEGAPPGAVVELAPEELERARGASSHAPSLRDALAIGRELGYRPEVRLIGIGGRRFELGDSPCREVVRAARALAERLEEELTCA